MKELTWKHAGSAAFLAIVGFALIMTATVIDAASAARRGVSSVDIPVPHQNKK